MAKNEVARPKVILDGKQAEEELDKLTAKAKKYRDAMMEAAAAGDSQKEKRLQQQLKATTTEIRNLKKEAFDVDRVLKNINGASFNELSQAVRKATSDLKKMQQTDPGYAAQKDKVVALKTKMAELSREQGANVPLWSRMANGANKYFNMITLGIASITGVLFSFAQFVKGMVGLDDALANVMKTTGLTRKEVRGMYQDFKLLNTRTPRAELLLLAEEAGRLGKVGKKDIMDFVTVANKIKIALGDDLGGNAEAAIKEVGKLTEIFRVGNQYGTDFKTSMEKIGSGINEVANNSNASAEYLIEYMKRLGGISTQAKITAADIMGYASTFDQLGQNVEMAATAQSKIIVDMFTDPGKYAKIAGMEVIAFSNLLKTDANEAFIKFLEGLNGNNEGLSEMATKLDSLGIDGARATQALASLSSNTKMLREQQDLANTAMNEGTSLQNEYTIKNNNLAGSWAKLTAFINAQFINSNFISFLENVIGKLAKMVEVTHPLTKAMKDEVTQVNLLTMELTNSNTPAQRRNEIYAELKRIAPDVVANIDAENISLSTLRGNLEKYNTEMIKKLALQDSEETLADKREASGKATNDRIESEIKLREELYSIMEQAKYWNKDVAKGIEDILLSPDDIVTKYDKVNALLGTIRGSIITSGKSYTKAVVSAREDEKKATDAVTKSLENYMQRYEMVFGKDKNPAAPPPSPPPPPLGGGISTDEQLKAASVKGAAAVKDPFAPEKDGEIDMGWIKAMAEADAIKFAEKKRSEEEWTAFLNAEIEKQMAIGRRGLEMDKEIEQAREELKDMRIDSVGQIAGALSGMFEAGSAAAIAFFAIEKAVAIAQIWLNYAKESSAIAVTAAAMNAVSFGVAGTAWAAVMQPKALLRAGVNTGIVVAQAIAQAAGSKKAGGFGETDPSDDTPMGVYHANEFIGSAKSVRNPTVKKVYDIVDLAQKNGTISTLNLPAVMAATGMLPAGRQPGGYASSPPGPSSSPSPLSPEILSRMALALENNEKTMKRIEKWNPKLIIEQVEKKLDEWKDIQANRGL